jgi:D-galactarolactone cycloisomerase
MLQVVNQKVVTVESYVVKLRAPDPYLGTRPGKVDTSSVDDGYYLRPPWRSLYSDRFESLLVRITCDDGSYGWGEALAPVAPEVTKEIVDRLLGPVLLGENPGRVGPLWVKLTGLMRERGHLVGHQADALAAVDIALWDLAGKACGLPVHALLGGAHRDSIPTYVSGLPKQTDAERAVLAADWAAKGVTAIKLHLGHGVAQDLATYDAVAAAAPGARIAVDAHWAYDLASALRLGRGLDERGAWFLEAPLVPEDVYGHKELALALVTPIALGEAMRNRFEFRAFLQERAVDLCQPDVGRTGITEAMQIASLASAFHVPVAPHHSVGLGIAVAAGLHVSAAIEDMPAFEFQPSTMAVANTILTQPLGGGAVSFALPGAPGLGVEADLSVILEDA